MSTICTFYDPVTTEITSVRDLSDETLEYYINAGASALIDVAGNPELHYVVDNELVEYTPEELAAKQAMPSGWQWVMPDKVAVDVRALEAIKVKKNAEINQKRLEANRSSFVFAGKNIACDELSMLDIQSLNGMITLIGGLPPGFQNQWKAMDNTYVAIPDKNTWIAFMGAMVSAGTSNFNHAQELKAALAAANTNAEVDLIQW